MMEKDEWILKMRLVNDKKVYTLMHECTPNNYSSTIPLIDSANSGQKVIGRVCFSCGKRAPAYKNSIIELSK